MTMMSGGEAIVHALCSQQVQAVFGVPGTHLLDLIDALHDAPGIRCITARHEQGSGFMADGYARASGRMGVFLSSTGPGAINGLTSIGTAFADSSPVLNIVSQIPSQYVGRNKGYVHEVGDQLGMFAPITKWRKRAHMVSELPGLIFDAATQMRATRSRPAVLEVSRDILEARADITIPTPAAHSTPPVNENEVRAAVRALLKARHPILWAGGGVINSGAAHELTMLAEALQAPVLTTTLGKGAIPSDHPLCLGNCASLEPIKEYLGTCDLILVVGSRLSALDTEEWKLQLPETLVHIDIDQNEISRNYPASVGVVGDAKLVMQLLLRAITGNVASERDRIAEVSKLRRMVNHIMEGRSGTAYNLISTIRSALPRYAIVSNDVTICAYWGWTLFDVYEARTYLYPWNFATLGFGLPAAIGAKIARPETPVLAICGDGGFLSTGAELATAVQFGINVVALVVNDNSYGLLEQRQRSRYGRVAMTSLRNPDFAALARSFGAHGIVADSLDEVGPALAEAFAANRPCVVELRMNLPAPFA